MTVSDIETAARRKYNSVNNSFYSSAEIYDLIYQAEIELAREALPIEATDTSITTVASTTSYAMPSLFIAIKRLEYDGKKLQPTDFREADVVNLINNQTPTTGTPLYYVVFKGYIYLYPTPNDAKTLTLYGYKEPTRVQAATTLEIPTLYHMDIVDYVCAEMAAKDLNFQVASYYGARWQNAVKNATKWAAQQRRTDGFNNVKDEEYLITSTLGII